VEILIRKRSSSATPLTEVVVRQGRAINSPATNAPKP